MCNYSSEKLREFHGLMAARGIPVVSNQVSFPNVYLACMQDCSSPHSGKTLLQWPLLRPTLGASLPFRVSCTWDVYGAAGEVQRF